LEYVVLVLIAIVVGFRLVKAWRRAKPTPQPEQPPATHSRLWFRAFAAAQPPSAVVRRYRGEPAPLVRSSDGS
jgi:hypothetical protein